MGSSNRIEIKFLHFQQIRAHVSRCYHASGFAIEVMAINSINNHPFAIDQEISPFDRNITKTDALREFLDNGPGRIFELYMEVIEIRLLCRPGFNIWEFGL